MDSPQYNHGEAFCLMYYQCQTCRHMERIWNSRDGVTPFGMCCTKCGRSSLDGGMQHVAFGLDERAPKFRLCVPGQYFWRDGTPEEAAAIMRERLDSCIGTQYEVTPERRAALIQSCLDGTCSEFPPGWPKLDRVPKPEQQYKTVMMVSGTVDQKHFEKLSELAKREGFELQIQAAEVPVANKRGAVFEADVQLRTTTKDYTAHRPRKLKGRNRRKW